MSKNYNLGSKSDMRRFQRDLEKSIKSETISSLHKQKYDVTCPHCGHSVKIPTGKSLCPFCHKEIDLTLDINL